MEDAQDSADGNSVEGNSVDGNSVDGHLVDGNSVEGNSVEANSTEEDSANENSPEKYRIKAKEILEKLKNIKFTREDLPHNFNIAASLRGLYWRARYKISEEFCKTALCDYLNEEHWAACVRDVFRDLLRAFPEAFEGPSNSNEVSKCNDTQNCYSDWAYIVCFCRSNRFVYLFPIY